jgi:hypothetical protein
LEEEAKGLYIDHRSGNGFFTDKNEYTLMPAYRGQDVFMKRG